MKKNSCDNFQQNSRICASLSVTLGVAIGKAGLYGAAVINMPKVIARITKQGNADALSGYTSPIAVFIGLSMFLRTGFVYGPEIYLQLAGRDRNKVVKLRCPKWLVDTEVQLTSIATLISGYFGAAVILNNFFIHQYADSRLITLSSVIAVSNYVGEYCLAGRAIYHALAEVNATQARRDSDFDYEALSNGSHAQHTTRCSGLLSISKSIALLFQSLSEAMVMVFLFYGLQKDNPAIPSSATITVGSLSAVSTFIRTGVLYAPRMRIVDDGLQTRKEEYLHIKCNAVISAWLISLSCAAGKMFAAAGGYSDGEMMLNDYIDFDNMNEAGYFSMTAAVIVFLMSSFVTEVYFNLVDSRVACSHIQNNMCCR